MKKEKTKSEKESGRGKVSEARNDKTDATDRRAQPSVPSENLKNKEKMLLEGVRK